MLERPQPAVLDEGDRALINALQGEFPISERPYAEAAAALGMSEDEVLARLQHLRASGVLTRFGPMFQIERMGGAFCLAALAVPEDDFERIAERVNALPQVAHNYRREHVLNMWFVLATETREGIGQAIAAIEIATGLAVHAFPKEREYFVEMRLRA
ncbi:Lrp/AsnC family transcriptional regulator [Denitratisoma sp. DHT3]|uniref:Lrp/AsnC family transcriptional regulator n=1 Tax=Denitratisoma sp. DHT3 TaxID=1981880 RepID=UPI0021BDACA5|nr:AsnC family transcriptional regulator [Denitratisoma sp. DHT3]